MQAEVVQYQEVNCQQSLEPAGVGAAHTAAACKPAGTRWVVPIEHSNAAFEGLNGEHLGHMRRLPTPVGPRIGMGSRRV